MDTRTAAAFFLRDDHRLCGLRLRPLTLRRWIRLDALLPGLLNQSRTPDLVQLWIAAQILTDQRQLRPLPWVALFWSEKKHQHAWNAYLYDQQSAPRYWSRESSVMERKVPWQISTAVYVAKGTSTPVEAVLDLPVSLVWWYQATLAEDATPANRPSPLISEADEADMVAMREDVGEAPPPEVVAAWQAWRAHHGMEEGVL